MKIHGPWLFCFVDERLAKLYWTCPHPEAKQMKSDNVPRKFILIQNPNPLRKGHPVQHLESHNSLRNWLHPRRTFGGLCWSWRYLKPSEELGANYPFSPQQTGHRPSKKYIILTIFEGFLVLKSIRTFIKINISNLILPTLMARTNDICWHDFGEGHWHQSTPYL